MQFAFYFKTILALFGLSAILLPGLSSAAAAADGKGLILFHNAKIIPMDQTAPRQLEDGTALLVLNGKIIEIAQKSLLERHYKIANKIDFSGATLLPGFIESHAHIAQLIQLSRLADVSPCLPDKFESIMPKPFSRKRCPVLIDQALEILMPDTSEEKFDENYNKVKKGKWLVGNGIDPSRMKTKISSEKFVAPTKFLNKPAEYIGDYIKNRKDLTFPDDQHPPVFLLDQSGHVGYVNLAAMQEVHGKTVCKSLQACPGVPIDTIKKKEYNPADQSAAYEYICNQTGSICNYNGRLLESGAYNAYLEKISTSAEEAGQVFLDGAPAQFFADGKPIVNSLAKSGITTFVNGGAFDEEEVESIKELALHEGSDADIRPMRFITLVAWDAGKKRGGVAQPAEEIMKWGLDIWGDEGQGYFGVQGVKLLTDGSTQGCSALLRKEYATGEDAVAICHAAKIGHNNFPSFGGKDSVAQIKASLQPYWNEGWYLNIHANGDAGISNAIDAVASLSENCPPLSSANASSNCGKSHSLIHFTVDGNADQADNFLIEKLKNVRKKVNLTTTHTIGHVAYWGGAFLGILDGIDSTDPVQMKSAGHGRSARLDPTHSLGLAHVPFSLNSDTPVTSPQPLWMIEQAVTRRSWSYPFLEEKQSFQMPGKENATVYQALLALTVVPAMQHQLSNEIGSIEVNKRADFVVLESNPLDYENDRKQGLTPDKISTIKVLGTYIDGVKVEYFP